MFKPKSGSLKITWPNGSHAKIKVAGDTLTDEKGDLSFNGSAFRADGPRGDYRQYTFEGPNVAHYVEEMGGLQTQVGLRGDVAVIERAMKTAAAGRPKVIHSRTRKAAKTRPSKGRRRKIA